MPSPPVPMRALLVALALTLALPVLAQPRADGPPAGDPLGTGAASDSVAVDSVAAASVAAAPEAEPTPVEVEAVVAPPQPYRFASATSALAVTLPPGWTGTAVDEGRLPAYARYAFADGAGTALVVERVVGLNELDRQRWQRGLTPYGYHGLSPVGPASVPLPGLGIEVAGGGVAGATVFLQRGLTFWAVHVQAPEAAWAARRDAVLGLLAGVSVP